MTLEEMMKALARLPLLFDPGDRFEYGMSTDVLGRVIEVASGTPLDEFFARRVFEPLGMGDTFFRVPSEKRHRLAAAYYAAETGIRKLKAGQIGPGNVTSDYPCVESHKYLSGGGGLCSTPGDYMQFCQMLLDRGVFSGRRLLHNETVDMMVANQLAEVTGPNSGIATDVDPFEFGFGFTIHGDQNVNEQLRGAYAWFGHWSTSFRISPRGDWILITMTQLVWDDKATPAWFAEYERIAAEAIQK